MEFIMNRCEKTSTPPQYETPPQGLITAPLRDLKEINGSMLLPDETLLFIFSLLKNSLKDLYQISLVCRHWKNVSSSVPINYFLHYYGNIKKTETPTPEQSYFHAKSNIYCSAFGSAPLSSIVDRYQIRREEENSRRELL